VDPQVKEGYELFVKQLSKDFDVVEVSIPHWEEALAAYYFIAPAEASSNLARYDGVRYGTMVEEETYWDTVRETRNLLGEEVNAAYYWVLLPCQQVLRTHFMKRQITYVAGLYGIHASIQRRDLLLTPTTPTLPFKLGEVKDPLQLYKADLFTTPANLAYLPAVSVPFKATGDPLPVGLQFIAPFGQDYKLLSFIGELGVKSI